jgi:hypothetical protein
MAMGKNITIFLPDGITNIEYLLNNIEYLFLVE